MNTMGVQFVHPERVHLVWPIMVLIAFVTWSELGGRDLLARFVSTAMQRRLADRPTTGRIVLRMVLFFAALVLGVLALMRPQTRGVAETVSSRVQADVVFALDVSRSMLAEDAPPSRLGRAKAEIDELLDKLPGHRVGLVAFAGRAVEICPLTADYGFFRTVLRETDTRSVGRGGTRIGDAMRRAVKSFQTAAGAKLIVLITDGEDQDSSPLAVAKEAAEAGIRVIAIGFGSEKGSELWVTDPISGARTAVVDRATGQPVVSRLDGRLLREVALATQGIYVPAGSSAIDLDSIVAADIVPILRRQADSTVRVVPIERYPWALLAALACLIGGVWVGASRRRGPGGPAGLPVVAVAFLLLGGCGSRDREARARYDDGVRALSEKRWDDAAKALLEAREKSGADDELRFRSSYDLGIAHVMLAESQEKEPERAIASLGQAIAWFRDATTTAPEEADARHNLEVAIRRLELLKDRAGASHNTLEARLEGLMAGARGLRDGVRAIVGKERAPDSSADPLAFQADLETLAIQARTLLADAGAASDVAGDDLARIEGKKPEERSDEEKVRSGQLRAVDVYLQRGRTELADLARALHRLDPMRGHQRAGAALDALKRAREQLENPVAVLRAIALDEAELAAETDALATIRESARRLDSRAPVKTPAWLTGQGLGELQRSIEDRLSQVTAALRSATESGDTGRAGGAEPKDDPKAAERAKVVALAREALPSIDVAAAAMGKARGALTADRPREAVAEEGRALEALAAAIERFADLRALIDLARGEQSRVVSLLTPPGRAGDEIPSMPAEARARAVGQATARNRERVARLGPMISDAKAAPAEAPAGRPDAPARDPQREQARRELYDRAEALRVKAAASLARVAATTGKSQLGPAREAFAHLDELQRLFFSVVERLRELVREQGETRDRTATAQSRPDEERDATVPSLLERQGNHAAMGEAIARALGSQADAAGQGGDLEASASAERLRQAAGEVQAGVEEMGSARDELARARESAGSMSIDLEPPLAGQGKALAHLQKALSLLEPPRQQEQKEQQQQQQEKQEKGEGDQKQQDQARQQQQRSTQAVRDREAEQRRRERQRQRIPNEPVEKDW